MILRSSEYLVTDLQESGHKQEAESEMASSLPEIDGDLKLVLSGFFGTRPRIWNYIPPTTISNGGGLHVHA